MAAWEAGQTRGQIAERLSVSQSWVGNVLRRVREGGGVEAKPHSGGRGRLKLGLASLGRLKGLVGERPDATLGELSEVLEASGGPAVSGSAVCRALGPAGMDLPLKKSRRVPPSRTGRT